MRLVSTRTCSSQVSPKLDLVSILSFPVVFVSSARESDCNHINMAKKIESHYFLLKSPDFFHVPADFPLPGVGRSAFMYIYFGKASGTERGGGVGEW